jgi:hypothetical protein
MPRLVVIGDDQQVYWDEAITASNFEAEHFRCCLADRIGWAVTDAESRMLIGGAGTESGAEVARLPRAARAPAAA